MKNNFCANVTSRKIATSHEVMMISNLGGVLLKLHSGLSRLVANFSQNAAQFVIVTLKI